MVGRRHWATKREPADTIVCVYQALLTRRYLTSKIMPLLSAAAVMLCTAMVLIVWSVMGGFLNMLLASGKQMMGDVSIAWPIFGLAHYDQLISDLEAHQRVDRATPTIEALGLMKLPTDESRQVQVIGIEPDGFNAVTGYYDRMYWVPLAQPLPGDTQREDPRLRLPAGFDEHGKTLTYPDPARNERVPAVVTGLEVSRFYERTRAGYVVSVLGRILPGYEVTISVLPLNERGSAIHTDSRAFVVANEFRTGLYEIDASQVLMPISSLQAMLQLDAQAIPDPAWMPGRVEIGPDGMPRPVAAETIGTKPARATNILVKAVSGVSPNELEADVREVYAQWAARYPELGAREGVPDVGRVQIFTWENKPGLRTFIQAVKKETALVLVLFVIISLVAVVLILAIFWSMVSEKTKDIGVLRAVGASRAGVAWLFLRYGLVIGVLGALVGGGLAYLIVRNINPIHEWMGRAMGLVIWDPQVYYFTTIPNSVDPDKAAIVMISGALCAMLGALIPAVRAAWMDPVKALRFE